MVVDLYKKQRRKIYPPIIIHSLLFTLFRNMLKFLACVSMKKKAVAKDVAVFFYP